VKGGIRVQVSVQQGSLPRWQVSSRPSPHPNVVQGNRVHSPASM